MNTKSLIAVICLFLTQSVGAQAAWQGSSDGVVDPAAMDQTMNPCQDFYQYACGGWLKNTQLPSDQSSWARSFSVIHEQNLNTLKNILTDYSKGDFSTPSPYAAKLGSYYTSCMDSTAVEKQTFRTLRAQLAPINKLNNKNQLPQLLAHLHLAGISTVFGFSAGVDLKNPDLITGQLFQGGLGLPDSTYYLKTDVESQKIRDQYQDHIVKLFALSGYNLAEAHQAAVDVMKVETAMARKSLPPEELQDPAKLYYPGDLAYVISLSPHFNWSGYFGELGIAVPGVINVATPQYMEAINGFLDHASLAEIKSYLSWHVISGSASLMGPDFYEEYFDFEGKKLSGRKAPSPRWKVCVNVVSGGMGEALGQAYVQKAFSQQAKDRVTALIVKLEEAFKNNLATLDWLDDSTRLAAQEKLSQITLKIGYPNKWKKYDQLTITDSLLQNTINSRMLENKRQLAQIGGKPDPSEWYMTPQTVNAYYDPNMNQINFPAGILQSPFFSNGAGDASNYGAIGMVIGHELTHGFDTAGSQFDGHGVMRDWWSPQVKDLFQQKASCLENQYNAYEPLPGVKVNGKLTITENIADQGGLKLAYAAFKLATANQKPVPSVIAGLSGDQQFFVAMSQMWCSKQTDQGLKSQVRGDPHSPAKYRVIGSMVNSEDFAKAFSCAPGTPMAPKNRCSIW